VQRASFRLAFRKKAAVAEATPHVRQTLFVGKADDGRLVAFAFLEDGRCAILSNGAIERACVADDVGVAAVLDRFFRLTTLCAHHDRVEPSLEPNCV